MPSKESGLIILEHKALESPLKVYSFWLRDHCRCAHCYGETSQRKFNITDIPLDVHPIETNINNNAVHIKCILRSLSILNLLFF